MRLKAFARAAQNLCRSKRGLVQSFLDLRLDWLLLNSPARTEQYEFADDCIRLLRSGADPASSFFSQTSAFERFCRYARDMHPRHAERALVAFLDAGSDPDAAFSNGTRPVHWLCASQLSVIDAQKTPSCALLALLARGADPGAACQGDPGMASLPWEMARERLCAANAELLRTAAQARMATDERERIASGLPAAALAPRSPKAI